MDFGNMAQWSGVIVTTGAVIVALFKEDIVKQWRRPELQIRMLLESPDCVQMPVSVTIGDSLAWQGKCYFFRLWVENKGHFAERVQVYQLSGG